MPQNEIWTATKLVHWISNDLKKRGLSPPHRLEAELLVASALSISRLDIYLLHDKPCTADERSAVRKLYKRRIQGEPIAYILGEADFWTLNLDVGTGVLIPRQDTETLIEVTLECISAFAKSDSPISILELGTGSGAIPLALCHESKNLEIITTDISLEAMKYASQNIKKYEAIISGRQNVIYPVICDKFAGLIPRQQFDIIVSNPPYIDLEEYQTLQMEVKDWEPIVALQAQNKGLFYYEYFSSVAHQYLKPAGVLIFEHGYSQAQAIKKVFNHHLVFQSSHKDLCQKDRVMVFQNN